MLHIDLFTLLLEPFENERVKVVSRQGICLIGPLESFNRFNQLVFFVYDSIVFFALLLSSVWLDRWFSLILRLRAGLDVLA